VLESLYNFIVYCSLSLTLYAARTMYVRCKHLCTVRVCVEIMGCDSGLLSCWRLDVLCVIHYLPSIICSYVFERNIPNPTFLLIVYCLISRSLSLNIHVVRTIV
jgi:hypothetical protein